MVKKIRLDSGSLLATEEIPHFNSSIFGIYVRIGSDYEPAELNGISHMTEHLMFKGTKSMDAKEIALKIEKLGGIINAYTARDHTCYYFKSLPENFIPIFNIFRSMIYESTIPPDELRKEKSVILEEIKSAEDDPEDLVFQNLNTIVFNGTPYAKTILGTEKSVAGVTRKNLQNFIENEYTDRNMFLVHCGKINGDALKHIRKSITGRPSPAKTARQKVLLKEIKGAYDYSYKQSLSQFHIAMGIQSSDYSSDDRYALLLLSYIIGTGMSSRLFRILREDRGFVYTVYSFTETFMESGMFGIYFACDERNISKAMKVIKREMRKIVKEGILKDELEKVKNQIVSQLIINYDTMSGRMGFTARNILYNDKVNSISKLLEKISTVGPDEISAAAEKYLDYDAYNVAAVGYKKAYKL